MRVVFQCLVKLCRSHAVSLLDRPFHGDFLVFHEIKIGPGFRELVFVEQVVQCNPGLCVKQRVMRAFPIVRPAMFRGKEVRSGKPDGRVQQFAERLWWVANLHLISQQVLLPRHADFRIAANLCLLVVQSKTRKVFRKTLVEPRLSWWIVVV